MKKFAVLMALLLILALTLGVVGCGSGGGGGYQPASIPITRSQTFTVAPNQIQSVFIPVNAGDRLTGSFSIQGGSGNDINFSVKDPLAHVILNQGRVSQNWQFDFVCSSTGSYEICFDNSFSTFSNKVVDLTTRVYSSQ